MSNDIEVKEQLSDSQKEQMAMMAQVDETPKSEVEVGSTITGKVVSISDESVFVDISLRNEAILDIKEVTDEDKKVTVAVGDELELHVVSATEDEVILSKTMKGVKAGKKLLRQLMDNATPVEGRITGINKGGFNVKVMEKRAFCPFSAIDTSFPEDPQVLLGKVMDFVISRIENRGNNIVLSRLPLLEGDIKEKIEELEKAVESKDPITGIVTRVANFGAFVDLGGVEGLVHISELTWDREEKTESVVKEGDNVSVIVLSVDKKEPLHESRISLSVKRLSVDPWDAAMEKFSIGAEVEVEVTRIVGFGAFVKLLPGVEALIRTEEMGWTKVRKPSKIVSKGQKIKAKIIHIDEESHKIDCSLKDYVENPWDKISEEFEAGSIVKGIVADQKEYGFFVDLNDEVTGLLRTKRIGKDMKGQIKKGEEIEVRIDEVDVDERRIALSCGDVPEFAPKVVAPAVTSTKVEQPQESDFAAALKAALNKKK